MPRPTPGRAGDRIGSGSERWWVRHGRPGRGLSRGSGEGCHSSAAASAAGAEGVAAARSEADRRTEPRLEVGLELSPHVLLELHEQRRVDEEERDLADLGHRRLDTGCDRSAEPRRSFTFRERAPSALSARPWRSSTTASQFGCALPAVPSWVGGTSAAGAGPAGGASSTRGSGRTASIFAVSPREGAAGSGKVGIAVVGFASGGKAVTRPVRQPVPEERRLCRPGLPCTGSPRSRPRRVAACR